MKKIILSLLIFNCIASIFASPSIDENLSSWINHSLEEACDYWCILPTKSLNINTSTQKVEFNYETHNIEEGAYIPGEDAGYFDYSKNEFIRTGKKEGTYNKVAVTYSCKVLLTVVNGTIKKYNFSGNKNALAYFKMEPKSYKAFKEKEIEELNRKKEDHKKKQEQAQIEKEKYNNEHPIKSKLEFFKESYFSLGTFFSFPKPDMGTGIVADVYFPTINLPTYPIFEFYYNLSDHIYYDDKQQFGTKFMLALSTNKNDLDFSDGALYIASGFSFDHRKNNGSADNVLGIPFRAGIRYYILNFDYTYNIRFNCKNTNYFSMTFCFTF